MSGSCNRQMLICLKGRTKFHFTAQPPQNRTCLTDVFNISYMLNTYVKHVLFCGGGAVKRNLVLPLKTRFRGKHFEDTMQ
jgi:hypothetical protein